MRSSAILSLFIALFVFQSTSLHARPAPQDDSQFPSLLSVPRQERFLAMPQLISPPRPSVRKRSYVSAFKHPRSRHDLAMREAVCTLGVDRHRFIRVELLDGRTLTGGVLSIGQDEFELSRGIMGEDEISYSSLRNAPQYDAAPGEHLLNGMKWTGLVAGDVVAFPFLLLLYHSLSAAGVLQD